VGDPSLDDPKRTLAADITKQNIALLNAANGKPEGSGDAATPTAPNEPPRSDQPSSVPQLQSPEGGSGVGVQILSAPSGTAAADPHAVIQPVGPSTAVVPVAEAPAAAPDQINEIKPGSVPAVTDSKEKKPKLDTADESSSKKKKKKGLSKLNPF
jgi:outer membrane protein assembly factor BamD